ncbi:MAG: methylmalonyl-CoA/ethylmalonyl-CoA epimerase [Candidatus Latescibacterota bacterium]|jgi:methylmalonyl-CoA/ethylmalonyl-CoA epimerase
MANESFGLTKIQQIAIGVDDLEKSTAFYRDQLGMQFLFGAGHMSFFNCDGLRFMLTTLKHNDANSLIYFDVPDIQTAFETLKNRGVSFDDEPHTVHETDTMAIWMTFFKDLEGNILAISSEVSK